MVRIKGRFSMPHMTEFHHPIADWLLPHFKHVSRFVYLFYCVEIISRWIRRVLLVGTVITGCVLQVLDILRSTELFAPHVAEVKGRNEDPVTSDLVGALLLVSVFRAIVSWPLVGNRLGHYAVYVFLFRHSDHHSDPSYRVRSRLATRDAAPTSRPPSRRTTNSTRSHCCPA